LIFKTIFEKIELPKYCKSEKAKHRLNDLELVSIASDAKKFVGNWNIASNLNLPFN
jgi:hypothetical protein